MRRLIYIVLIGIMSVGCDRGQGEEMAPGVEMYALSVGRAVEADSAVVFIFRKFQTGDSLITWKRLGRISGTPNTFVLDLPAGYYIFRVFTNISMDRVVIKPPFTPDDLYVEYADGTEPPVIYFGAAYANVGTNKTVVSGMVPVTSFVELTIKNVPEGVDQIDIDLLNTAAGFYLQQGYLDEKTDPSLIVSVYDVKADSTYVVPINCFPNVEKYGKSSLDVRCYDVDGNLKYRGSSAPFDIKSRMIVSCSFGSTTVRSGRSQNEIIEWEYGK